VSEAERWIASGGHALTGRRDGPARHAPGRPASAMHAALTRIGRYAPGVQLPGVELIGERARSAGLTRNGPASCGGAFRPLRTLDGWIGLSLPRRSDVELLPALTCGPATPEADPWAQAAHWAARTTGAQAEQRIGLLGLAGGVIPDRPPRARPPVLSRVLGVRRVRARPLVVDLTSLWAGPLCARLLGLTGARVVKVESRDRPDGARFADPGFFERLHAGHDMLSLDFGSGIDELRDLIARADLVLEASRPRALAQLGIDAEAVVAAGTSWLSITARGRASPHIGFGDDVAACAGMVVREDDAVLPVGDALADPLTGVFAALAGVRALAEPRARLIDVSMLDVVAATLAPR